MVTGKNKFALWLTMEGKALVETYLSYAPYTNR